MTRGLLGQDHDSQASLVAGFVRIWPLPDDLSFSCPDARYREPADHPGLEPGTSEFSARRSTIELMILSAQGRS